MSQQAYKIHRKPTECTFLDRDRYTYVPVHLQRQAEKIPESVFVMVFDRNVIEALIAGASHLDD